MKPIFQINHRHGSSAHTARMSRRSPKTYFDYQAATLDDIRGRPVEDCKPPFHALSRDYFAREAHLHFRDRGRGFFPAHDDDHAAVVQWGKRRRGADPLDQGSILIPAIR
jgi:hypothetical protein